MAANADAEQHRKRPVTWLHESYKEQSRKLWPGRGQHILAQFETDCPPDSDEKTIVVYQAYNETIAKYAVEHKKFSGCKLFGEARMTWIKTNFLWMMFRSNWGSKKNQDHILAIWLKQSAFDKYLENARERGTVRDFKGSVRLQWDPDHDPQGARHPYRRAVQLGLRNVTSYITGEDILWIEDISDFVHTQGRSVKQGRSVPDDLQVARERVYTPSSGLAVRTMNLSPAPSDELQNKDDADASEVQGR